MIELSNVTISNGSFRLHEANLSLPAARYGVLMGKSGAGKTTLLEAVCGLKRVESGTIRVGDAEVTDWTPAQRGIGFVPQDGALFSAMSVRQHLAFPLMIRRVAAEPIRQAVGDLAERLQLENLLDRLPHELSGGERQRVALGRAISFRPKVLCLDEPLSSLDDDTRRDMITLLQELHQALKLTVLHVTHNRSEAEALADCRFELIGDGIAAEPISEKVE